MDDTTINPAADADVLLSLQGFRRVEDAQLSGLAPKIRDIRLFPDIATGLHLDHSYGWAFHADPDKVPDSWKTGVQILWGGKLENDAGRAVWMITRWTEGRAAVSFIDDAKVTEGGYFYPMLLPT